MFGGPATEASRRFGHFVDRLPELFADAPLATDDDLSAFLDEKLARQLYEDFVGPVFEDPRFGAYWQEVYQGCLTRLADDEGR